MPRSLFVTVFAIAGLSLGGCGGSDSGADSGAKAAPATGPVMSGPGYALHLTGAWKRNRDAAEQALGGQHASDGPGDLTVTQTRLAAGADPQERLREFNAEELTSVEAATSTRPRAITLDGSAGTSFQFRTRTSTGTDVGRFVNVVHGGVMYAIGFEDPLENGSALDDFAAMLSSWRWSD